MWKPLGAGSVSNRVAQQIQDLIKTKRLKPHDQLPPERELALLLGVSRPSVREAFKSLQAQAIVDVRHGHGVFVSEPRAAASLKAALIQREIGIEELFAMREVLELPAAQWAAQRQDRAGIEAITAAFTELDDYSRSGDIDYEKLRALDVAFHVSIVDAAGNAFLQQTTVVLHDILAGGMETTLKAPGRLEKSRIDHQRIHDAIVAGDEVAARQAALVHIEGARAAARAAIAQQRAAGEQPGELS